MCGIGGLINVNLDGSEIKNVVTSLLLMLERRGDDATGIFMVFRDKSFLLRKMYWNARKFVDYLSRINVDWNNVHYVTMHTRAATSGTPMNNENNHPLYEILDDNVVTVVHNGVISYVVDNELAHSKVRDVDSDYLLSGIRVYQRYDLDVVKETIENIYGSIACIYADLHGLIIAYRNYSPLSMLQSDRCIILASEREMLEEIAESMGLKGNVKELEPYTYYVFNVNSKVRVKRIKGRKRVVVKVNHNHKCRRCDDDLSEIDYMLRRDYLYYYYDY